MKRTIKHLWHHHKALLLAFVIAATLTLLFAARMVMFSLYWSNPAHQNQPLQGWMTPRYVAYSYGLKREELRTVLGFDPAPVARLSLKDLLQGQGVSLNDMQTRIDAIMANRTTE